MATQALLTAEQFLGLPPTEGKIRELDEGRLIEMPPPNLTHMLVVATVMRLVQQHLQQAKADFFDMPGLGFRLATTTLRIPDVLLIRKAAARTMQALGGWYEGTPDLAVEVVSPSDTAEDLDRRVHQYLAAGSSTVWVVYPDTRHVMVHQSDGTTLDRRGNDVLTVPALLPDMRLPVSQIFADL